jgi:hypothetical protein
MMLVRSGGDVDTDEIQEEQEEEALERERGGGAKSP